MRHRWPTASASIEDTDATVTIAGISHSVHAQTIEEARDNARSLIAAWARHFARPVYATVTDPEGEWTITVSGDGIARDTLEQKKTWRNRK